MHNPINSFYTRPEVLKALRQQYQSSNELPSIALGGFLLEEEILNLRALTTLGWVESYVPDKRRFEERKVTTPEERELLKLIKGFVKQVTGKEPLREGTRRYRHQSYTILHDKDEQKAGVVAYLFLGNWSADWGGQVVFTRKGETLGSFTPQPNTLLVVERKRGVRSFVKYVNHKAARHTSVIISP